MDKDESFKLYLREFTKSGDPIQFVRRNPQIPYPLHTHDFSELVIILDGRGKHITEHSSFDLLAGDVFVIKGGESHGYENPENLHLINIMYRPELLSKNVSDLTALPGYHVLFNLEPEFREYNKFISRLHLTPQQIAEIVPTLKAIEFELESYNPGRLFIATSYFYTLTGYLCRIYTSDDLYSNRKLLRIGKALSLIENSHHKHISLKELAEATSTSISTLNRIFKESTGFSPIEYHIRIRIKKASRNLCSTNLSIAEIANLSGFDDSNYFSRQFKRITGFSPTEFRKRYK